MRESVKVACVQAAPVVLDRDATLDKLAELTAEAAAAGARLVAFPETFVSVYPSSVWGRFLGAWSDERATAAFAKVVDQAVAIPGEAERRLAEAAQANGVWLATGVNEVDPRQPGTIYNSLLFHRPDGVLALHHRKLVPTNHERLIWGQGDGRGLRAIDAEIGRLGGLVCWENYMPLARFALYESGLEIYVAPAADDDEAWQATLVHLARESRAFLVSPSHFQHADAYPANFPLLAELHGAGIIGRGGSAVLAPDGAYLAGPLYDEEGILYAELEPERLHAARQRFDPAGHYHRPDLLKLTLSPESRPMPR
jgi:nitrilase